MTPLEAATPTHGYWIMPGSQLKREKTFFWLISGQETVERHDLVLRLANDQLVVVRKKRWV